MMYTVALFVFAIDVAVFDIVLRYHDPSHWYVVLFKFTAGSYYKFRVNSSITS